MHELVNEYRYVLGGSWRGRLLIFHSKLDHNSNTKAERRGVLFAGGPFNATLAIWPHTNRHIHSKYSIEGGGTDLSSVSFHIFLLFLMNRTKARWKKC